MEKRKIKRRHIIYYLKVFDSETDLLLGQLVNITTDGFQMVGEEPIAPGIGLDLKMQLPEKIHNKKIINFNAECMWCKRDVNPSYFSTGFEYRDISKDDLNIINSLIYDFSFHD